MTELTAKVHELRELRRMADEISAEIDALTDAIKAVMTADGVDTINGTDFRVTWKAVSSDRLDAAALKKALPDIAAQFTRKTTTRRFVLA